MELTVRIKKKLRNFTLAADFSVKDEVFALLGASGCGKSMTLKCIAGIETPDSGSIVLNGRVLYDSDKKINLSPQKRRVGYLFQNYALFPNMTIRENIRFAAGGTAAQKDEKVQANLERFSLLELADAYPAELSGGQQQRAAFARILASDAELLLLDEPFSALDSYLKWQLELELGKVLPSYEGTALLVSHDRGEVYRLADTVAVINQGKMEKVHEKKELFQKPGTLAAALLTGCKNVSAASRLDAHHVRAEDWQFDLLAGDVAEDIKYVGIRAHFLEFRRQPGENTIPIDIVKVIEDTFSMLVMVRKAGSDGKAIRCELPKKEWQQLKDATELYLYFPPEKIMVLQQ
ncbi:sulfate/molybdate ABC transporter ATP-binding protein [Selenomonas ruminis]|uniref:ATP-binding cassette domain-containing protein n=1 Tax=Selenomonas ruminis TaxID=2593411 RepID=A0A5D6W487_9FIRM|nr:ATP-binding cassette domain-containing protein [Selenomonas sp. mPRGC5]TYZ22610.1 ATP-binding cassette domain-containing protein [Selenomonas sp. mPRGC5]